MFESLKKLYESELHSNVNQIATVILSAYKLDRSILSADQYFLTLCYYANSLYEERLYRRAEEMFKNAILARKSFMKAKQTLASYDSSVNCFPEVEIRYKLALCYQATKQMTDAIATLQKIAMKNRPAKVNMLLFKLLQLQHSGNEKTIEKNGGPNALKALIKECPLNLDAIKGLLALGVKTQEIQSLIGDDSLSPPVKEWLNHFIDAHSKMHSSQFQAAIESLKVIESNNEAVLVLIGQCYHYIGNSEAALTYLTRAYQLNNYLTDGLMTLAAVYANLNRLDDLEKLTPPNLTLTDSTPEYWFVLAQHLYCQGKHDRAAYFAQKSCYLKPKNAEASLLKVKIFLHFKKYKDAIVHLRALEEYAAYRFEIYELLVDAYLGELARTYIKRQLNELNPFPYLATNRFREAQEISRRLFKRQGSQLVARSYVLAAKTYFSQADPLIKIKAKSLLENALEKDPYCLPAVFMMVDLLLELGDNGAAIKLITKQCTVKPNSKLHAILGDILSKDKSQMKAVENYTIAINMDPSNRRAIAGLMLMGQPSSQSSDETEQERTYAFEEMLEVPTNQQAEAESETDVLWG